ncbi:hypothetical protein ME121_0225 [Methylobacterium sp. ME121]|jgi:hypothetical protein|nr:hypothetical protein C7388_101181 [Methylobacterium organophilum]GAN46222.1 hypothetical protein ME121_0225 [Methylobacterium sp. ME121]
MINRTKPNRVSLAPRPRVASPGTARPGRSGSARRVRAGAGSSRARIGQGLSRDRAPTTAPRWDANPYEAFYALSADGVGLLDPGFDDWDLDPCVLVGLAPNGGDERDDT